MLGVEHSGCKRNRADLRASVDAIPNQLSSSRWRPLDHCEPTGPQSEINRKKALQIERSNPGPDSSLATTRG